MRSLHHKKTNHLRFMREGVRWVIELCLLFLKMVRSIRTFDGKAWVVALCSLYIPMLSLFLSYTSTRIPAISIFLTSRHLRKSWDNKKQSHSLLTNLGVLLSMKHVSWGMAGDGGTYGPSHRGAGQVLKKTGWDRLRPSTPVRLQDGRTAPLRTLTLQPLARHKATKFLAMPIPEACELSRMMIT